MARKEITGLNLTKEFLLSISGEHGLEVVKTCLKKDKDLTDEEIGKTVPLKITEIRTILNRLHYRGIACYNKKKSQKAGWYSYTWTINSKRIAELILEQYVEQVEQLEEKLIYERNYTMFACPKKCNPQPFEVAMEYQFKCPECGETMNEMDSKKISKLTSDKIETLKSEIKALGKHV
ncbi:MAG: hypothetical protein V1847_04610 [Candidatus Diapherotrites archaeon]